MTWHADVSFRQSCNFSYLKYFLCYGMCAVSQNHRNGACSPARTAAPQAGLVAETNIAAQDLVILSGPMRRATHLVTTPLIQCLTLRQFDDCVPHLAELLHACVHDGASIGFVLPFSPDDAKGFWLQRIRSSLASGKRVVMIARIDQKLAGTVQLNCDLMPNQDHRGDVSKLLVHPAFRRRGIARLLMAELERQAILRNPHAAWCWITRTGDAAEPLYGSLGYETAAIVPGFAPDPLARKF